LPIAGQYSGDLPRGLLATQDRHRPQGALATFRNLAINTFRLNGRANIAHARRDLLNRDDAFAAYGI
jgi:hypothetical protein